MAQHKRVPHNSEGDWRYAWETGSSHTHTHTPSADEIHLKFSKSIPHRIPIKSHILVVCLCARPYAVLLQGKQQTAAPAKRIGKGRTAKEREREMPWSGQWKEMEWNLNGQEKPHEREETFGWNSLLFSARRECLSTSFDVHVKSVSND